MHTIRMIPVLLAASLVPACTSDAPVPEAGDADPGAELLAPFKKDLKAALKAGMQEGVTNAVSVCKEQAPALADANSVDGVQMGRASHRRRNPGNTGPAWVGELVNDYVGQDGDWQPVSVTLDDGRRGYVEPIVVQPVCLACHGESLAPEVAEVIADEYPDDRATGFRAGDFRGVFWVEYPGAD